MSVVSLPRPHERRARVELSALMPSVGMTSQQVELAIDAVMRAGSDDHGMLAAWTRVADAIGKLEGALEDARARTLGVLLESHPAAARRIMGD